MTQVACLVFPLGPNLLLSGLNTGTKLISNYKVTHSYDPTDKHTTEYNRMLVNTMLYYTASASVAAGCRSTLECLPTYLYYADNKKIF